MAELKYWLWLASRRGIGAGKMNLLLQHFGGPEEIYFARQAEYEAVVEGNFTAFSDKSMDLPRKIWKDCQHCGATILTLGDADYPARLKAIHDPPPVLYLRGKLPAWEERPVVAIVGTRKCTPYGLYVAEEMAYGFTAAGGMVTSGLAVGIDSASAQGAIRAGGGFIGVLGSGIDVVYPKTNERLFAEVLACGALVSEYPPGRSPDRSSFPARNRIISGLSQGVVVVEAPEHSGALITAAHALEQGRDVFAVPGYVGARACVGTNALLREGASPVTTGQDLVAEYLPRFPQLREKVAAPQAAPPELREPVDALELPARRRSPRKPPAPQEKAIDNQPDEDYIEIPLTPADGDPVEETLLRAMSTAGMHVDDIIARVGLPAGEVLSALTLLELNGKVTRQPGNRYAVRRK